ncbi:hypothetical protein ABZ707_01130 [Streptomyces sp. NPDC006923]|uniref:hypothetical protein n=1 Tax=Streptomyces sp. NPDC006923 TaxID=3155355 RepID=UPI0033E1620D
MAKNKNRDRNKQQGRPAAPRGAEQAKSSMEDQAEQMQSRIAPAEAPHKGRQKRFGHN